MIHYYFSLYFGKKNDEVCCDSGVVAIQSHRLLFPHASAEVRGENTPERKFALTGDRTHNHQAMSPTRSPLSHPGGAFSTWKFHFKSSIFRAEHGHRHALLVLNCHQASIVRLFLCKNIHLPEVP